MRCVMTREDWLRMSPEEQLAAISNLTRDDFTLGHMTMKDVMQVLDSGLERVMAKVEKLQAERATASEQRQREIDSLLHELLSALRQAEKNLQQVNANRTESEPKAD